MTIPTVAILNLADHQRDYREFTDQVNAEMAQPWNETQGGWWDERRLRYHELQRHEWELRLTFPGFPESLCVTGPPENHLR